MDTSKIISLLGEQSEFLLGHTCKTIDKSLIHIPSPSVIDSIWIGSDRKEADGWQIRDTSQYCLWTKISNIRRELPSLRTRSISIRKTSSGWLLKEDVTE